MQEATSNAFPMRNPDPSENDEFGLTKREYFAAMAMQGILSGAQYIDYEKFAKVAVESADALIAELNK